MSNENGINSRYEFLPERLESYAVCHDFSGEYTEANAFYDAAHYIRRLETIIGHLRPEHNQNLFICGVSDRDDSGMPEKIEVCPEFGADVSYIYERVK